MDAKMDPTDEQRPILASQVLERVGRDPARCYQCGKCTAGCPMSAEMPIKVGQIMRLVQLDRRERIFRDSSIWLCLTCETCSARCPMDCEPATVLDALREMVVQRDPALLPVRIRAMHQAFLAQIRKNGRVFEMGLVMGYKVRSGALMDDMTTAPGLYARGKLALTPRKLRGIADVQRIFNACGAQVGSGVADSLRYLGSRR